MPDQVSFAKGSTKPTSGITVGRLYVVDSSTTDKSDLYLGKDATHLIQVGATVAQGAKADSSVQSINVGSTSYSPSSGVVSLPAYPTTLPASDVYAWAKASTKPSYNLDEVPDGTNRKLSRYIPYNDVLMPTNPFGGKMLYINSIDNAFASAPKRYYVTGTIHLKTVNGVNYPYEDTSKAITDDNYWVDSPVVSTLTSAQCQSLFDGSYEGGYTIPVGHYLKLRIMFGTNTSPSASTSYFPGYPYGSYYLSYYYTGVPSSAEAHIYNKYAAHTVGWHKYQATYFVGSSSSTNSVIQQISDGGDYQRTCVDFIIKSPDSGTATCVTEIDYQLSRPSLSRDGSTVTKYGNQVLYHSFLWNNGTENGGTNTIQIDPNGTISAISFTENGTALSSKYGQLSAVNTWTSIQGIKTTSVPALELKNTSPSGGAFIDYENNNQTTNYWRAGMAFDNVFSFIYKSSEVARVTTDGALLFTGNGTSTSAARIEIKDVVSSTDTGVIRVISTNSTKRTLHIQPDIQAGSASGTAGVIIGGTVDATPDTTYKLKVVGSANATTLYENGTALSSKYGSLGSANSWTGNNTFTGSLSATDGASLSADSGDVALSVSPSGIDLNSRYGVNISSSERGYILASEPIRYNTGVSPSNNQDLVTKTYVDSGFVDKSTNQSGIAGNKTWTGISTFNRTASAYNEAAFSSRSSYSVTNDSGDFSAASDITNRTYTFGISTSYSKNSDDYMYWDSSNASMSINSGYKSSISQAATPSIYFNINDESDLSPGYGYFSSSFGLYSSGNAYDYSNKYIQASHDADMGTYGGSITFKADGEVEYTWYDWGTIGDQLYLKMFPDSDGNIYIGDPNSYGVVSFADIVSHISCFRGDTTYVTMYDGSKKLISDVKEGDSVLGYDVNKKDYCEAIVIKNVRTGEQMGYNCYVMEDGTTIDIHGDDNFITNVKDKSFCDEDGDFLSLHSMVKNLMEFHNKNDDTHKIIKDTGNTDGAVCLIHSFWTPCAELTPRYSLYTSNGTMFVNGLLSAQSPRDTIDFFRKRRFQVPDSIKSIFKDVSESMSSRDESLPDDKISNPSKAEHLAKLNEAKVKIAVFKKKLADTDYKFNKYSEGELTEEEWLPIKEQRKAWRHTVNRMEEIVAEYQPIVEEENPEMFDHDWKYKNNKWKYRQSIFDAHLEDFREWQENIKEERQKRIEESKEHSRLRAEEIKANKSSQKK